MRIRWDAARSGRHAGHQRLPEKTRAAIPLAHLHKLYGKIRSLKESPNIGRPGRIEGTREILFSPMPYVAVYRVQGETIEVWRIWYTSQRRD